MRLTSTRFQLHAVGKKGAIVHNDGELLLPPVVQPGIILGDPVSAPGDRGGDTSSYAFLSMNRVGAGAAATADTITFQPGSWLLQANAMQIFNGASNFVEDCRISMFDAGATNEQVLFMAFLVSNVPHIAYFERWLHMSATFFFRLKIGATIAGDTARLLWSYNLQRVL